MFTGLIETVGTVDALRRSGGGARLAVSVQWPDREIPEDRRQHRRQRRLS